MMTRELAAEFKKACEEQDCETCPFSVGVYMEGLDYVYYSCDIRKKPRDYDIAKERMKQTKADKDPREAIRQAKKKEKEEKERKKAEIKAKKKVVEAEKEKKKRGRPKKSDIMVKNNKGKEVLF